MESSHHLEFKKEIFLNFFKLSWKFSDKSRKNGTMNPQVPRASFDNYQQFAVLQKIFLSLAFHWFWVKPRFKFIEPFWIFKSFLSTPCTKVREMTSYFSFIVLSSSQKLSWIINLDRDFHRCMLNPNLVNLVSQWSSWRRHSDLVVDDIKLVS